MKLTAICGSLPQGSPTWRLMDLALDGARLAGAEVTRLDLGDPPLPLFEGDAEVPHSAVARLREAIAGCDILLLATPVIHDSFSGALKNALDFLYGELTNKMAAIMAVGTGPASPSQALEHLAAVLRETGTWVLPNQVAVPHAERTLSSNGELEDPELGQRLFRLGQELVRWGRVLPGGGSRPRADLQRPLPGS